MAVIPLVPETKMVDVGKLISLGKLLVRKVLWFVFTTTSATLVLSHVFGVDCMTRIAYILSSSKNSFSFRFFTYRDSLHPLLSLSHILTSSSQPHENVYICNLFLSYSALSVRLLSASNTASEILSNPERDKQPTWEKTRSSLDTLLYISRYLTWNT